ncbi:SatD family protein [[Mycobacterium] wendilense]|uniref:SatD family protein n=1 Tax=[Mycobacterium] wendilense TaxID=3064284 RepID=A0ABM9M8V1_9MYCO|nr:SatD family protein [Mycolicibacterium sp. MU0050]CAJ1579287.1 SatD family protein [Mycolicibacterium sp. MU0050]
MSVAKRGASPVVATLIGDVVGSRLYPDRRELHGRLTAALQEVAAGAADAPAITVGDEFQGTFGTVGAAIDAAFTLRLLLNPGIDVRFGLGWGAVTQLDPATGIQDGPGWWAAREAIEWVSTQQEQTGFTQLRTAFRNGTDAGADPHAVNAALMCRDHLLGSLDERSLRLLAGLRAGRSKKELAMAERISPSAVSQRAGRAGLDLLLAAAEELRQLR